MHPKIMLNTSINSIICRSRMIVAKASGTKFFKFGIRYLEVTNSVTSMTMPAPKATEGTWTLSLKL